MNSQGCAGSGASQKVPISAQGLLDVLQER